MFVDCFLDEVRCAAIYRLSNTLEHSTFENSALSAFPRFFLVLICGAFLFVVP